MNKKIILFIILYSVIAIFVYGVSTARLWKKYNIAIEDGLPKTAITTLDTILTITRQSKNHTEYITALINKIVLEANVQGERSEYKIEMLKKELPNAPTKIKPMLEAILAYWHWHYFQRNRYRFMKRTQTENLVDDDLTTWDLPKVFNCIDSLYQNLLGQQKLLGSIKIEAFKDFLVPGNTPIENRSTLYDFIAHEALKFYTSAEQVAAHPEDMFEIDASTPAFGPINEFILYTPATTDTGSPKYKALRIYKNLMNYHFTHNNIDALVDLDIHRLKYIKNVAYGDNKSELYIERLGELLEAYPNTLLYSVVAFCLAEAWGDQGDLRKAYDISEMGYTKYPESYGGQACHAHMIKLMQKNVQIHCERYIPPRTTPIIVNYSNFTTLYFRIYKDRWDKFLHGQARYPNETDTVELHAMISQEPLMEWGMTLPETPDLKAHTIKAQIPQLKPGYYRIIASCDKDFLASQLLVHSWFWVSNITMINRSYRYLVDGLVVDAVTGEPESDIKVREITDNHGTFQYGRTTISNAQGYFKFDCSKKRYSYRSYLLLESNTDTLLSSDPIGPSYYREERPQTQVFFFSDRSLYRPGQAIYFKGICVRIDNNRSNYEVIPRKEVAVYFIDVNGQSIDSLYLLTNDFGSFSGQFTVPKDRLTGRMRIYTKDPGGSLSLLVEEYKRPKFSVELETPNEACRINDTIRITGNAITFSGAPVNNASVRFRVMRDAYFPAWHGWHYPYFKYKNISQCIAHGTSKTNSDGTFTINFTAKPDMHIPQSQDPRFRFRVSADVISPDGETRSASTTIIIGYTTLALESKCYDKPIDNQLFHVEITTQTLNGKSYPGYGELYIYQLKQPDKPICDLQSGLRVNSYNAFDINPDDQEFTSDWTTWPIDTILYVYPFTTTDKNPQAVRLTLPTGLYKLKGVSRDTYGTEIQTWLPIMVLPKWNNEHFPLKLPFITEVTADTVLVGQNFSMLWGTGYETGRCFIEIEAGKKIIDRYWTKKDHTQHSFVLPVTEKYRGGFMVHMTQVRENRMYQRRQSVYVPWDNKELIVETTTFHDKVMPGESEKIALKISGKTKPIEKAEIVAAMYDYSLDLYYKHGWPKFDFYKRFESALFPSFVNRCNPLSIWRCQDWNEAYAYPRVRTFIGFPEKVLKDFLYYQFPLKMEYVDINNVDHRIIPAKEEKEFEGEHGVIKGQILDAETGEPLNGADVIIMSTNIGATSDEKGNFTILNVPEGKWHVTASFISYDPFSFSQVMVKKGHTTSLVFRLRPTIIQVQGVTAVATRPEIIVSQTSTGRAVMDQIISEDKGIQTMSRDEIAGMDIRKNFNETAFFYPHLTMDHNGTVQMEYTMPEALTRWKFMGFVHGKRCECGSIVEFTVTQKNIMVQANPPRFLRECDTINFTAKVINMSDSLQQGIVQIEFYDAVAETSVNKGFMIRDNAQSFKVGPKLSETFSWELSIPRFTNPVSYTVVAKSASLSDGETGIIPVLSSRIYLTETMPLHVRGQQTKYFTFNKLAQLDSSLTMESHRFTVQMVSNPSWYAIQALPFLMEFQHECTEQIFNRYYANMLAGYIIQKDTVIRKVFESWQGTSALESNLEKNQQLKSVLLEETPWVKQAKSETEAKQRIAILFEPDTLIQNLNTAFKKLVDMQYDDGSWPWFPGGLPNPYITTYIVTGFGRLRAMNVNVDINPALSALSFLDEWVYNYYLDIIYERRIGYSIPSIAFFLYGRSFFMNNKPLSPETKEAVDYFLDYAEKHWLEINSRMTQGYLALALNRFGRETAAQKIMASIKERSVSDEELGMYWREEERSWWWYHAPIETQALMIEAFDQVMHDSAAVEECKVWLLKQKQTLAWRTTKATADVVYALLCRGADWLASEELVEVKLGNTVITPESVEAGTNFYEKIFNENEIETEFADISVTKKDPGIAWGGAYFQYFEEMSAVTAHATNLQLEKKIFLKEQTKKGEIIRPLSGSLHVGDLITNRIILRVDRDMEFVHLKDLRGSGLEPVDVLSRYKYQDGLRYYQSTKDVATHFFIDYLPKGTYVFEYDLRVQLKGKYQSGIAEIQCMYAPEFTSHSESILLEVE